MPALKLIQLKHDSVVTFKPITQEYGRAEFIFCTQWKASKLQRFFIYPMQQPDAQFYYEVPCGKSENFSITAWTHKGMTEPNVWISSWCKQHRCLSQRAYVPRESNCFVVMILTNASVNFDRQ